MESKVRSLAQVCDLALAGFSSTLYGYKGRVEYATFQPPPDILRQIPEVRFDDSSERWRSVPATAKLDRTALRKRHHVVPDPDWDPPIKKPKFYYPPSKGVKLRDVDELIRESRETKGMSPKEYDEYRRKKQLDTDKSSHSTPSAVVPQKQQSQSQSQSQQQQQQQQRSNTSNANPVQDILNEITAASKPRSDGGSGNKTKERNASGLGVRKNHKDEHLFKKPSATTIQRKGSNSSSSSGSTPATASRGTTSAKSVGKRPTPAPMQKRPCVDLLMIRDHLLDINSEDRVETRKIANLLKRNVSTTGHMSILVKKKPKLVLHIPKPEKDLNQPEKVTMIGKYKVKHKSGSNSAATPETKPVVKKDRNVKQQQQPKSIDIPRDSKEQPKSSSASENKKQKDVKREPPASPSASSGNDKFTLPTGTVTAEFLKTIRIPKRKPTESSTSTTPAATTTTSTSSSTIVDRELEEGETISPSPSPVHRGQQQQQQPSSLSSSPPPPPQQQQQQPLPSSSTTATAAISRERSRSPSPSRTRRDRSLRHDDEKRSTRHREESDRRRGTSSDQRRDHSVDDRRRHRRDSRQSSSDDLRHQRHRSRSPSTRKHRHDRSSRSRSDSRRRSRSPRRRSSNLSSTNSSCRSKSPPSRPHQQPTFSSADTPAANTLASQPSSEPSPPKPNYKNATSADAESEDQCKLFAVMFRKLATAYKHRGDPRQSDIAGLLDHIQAILNYVLSFYYQDLKTNEYSGLRHWESLFPFSSQVLRNLKDRKELDLYALCCRMMGMVRYYTFVRREASASKKLDNVIKKEVEPNVTQDATKASKQAFAEFEEAYNRFKEADRHLSYEQFRTNYPNTFNNACLKGEYGPGIVIGGEAGTSIEPRFPFIPFAKLHHAAIVCKCMLAEYVEKNAIKYTPIQDFEEYM